MLNAPLGCPESDTLLVQNAGVYDLMLMLWGHICVCVSYGAKVCLCYVVVSHLYRPTIGALRVAYI